MSGGSCGACMCWHEPRTSSILLKVLELISQQKQVFPGLPTETYSLSVSDRAAALAELHEGLNWCLGVGLAAWQSHTRNTLLHSSAWCTLPHSSGLNRNISLWNFPDLPKQRGPLFFLVLAELWTAIYFYTYCIARILFATTTVSFVILWTFRGKRLSLISLCFPCAKNSD